MEFIESEEQLDELYGKPAEASILKVCTKLTPGYRAWIGRSKLCILSTVGPEGTDASPRGEDGPVVKELDEHTLALPDWRGNNRIDSLRNIVRDDRISLMFFINGSNNVVRINGRAKVTTDSGLIKAFIRDNNAPRSIIVIKIDEVYFQCARALMRSGFWTDRPQTGELPSIGELLNELSDGDFDANAYDREWPKRAAKTMW